MHRGKTWVFLWMPSDVLADLGWTVMECAGSDGCFMSIDGNVMVMLGISLIVVGYVIGNV